MNVFRYQLSSLLAEAFLLHTVNAWLSIEGDTGELVELVLMEAFNLDRLQGQ